MGTVRHDCHMVDHLASQGAASTIGQVRLYLSPTRQRGVKGEAEEPRYGQAG